MRTFEALLVEPRVGLIRLARLKLRNDDRTKAAVSETLLAALAKPQSFDNRAQLKTWLGILKYIVIDLIRSNARTVLLPELEADREGDELDRLTFKADGHFAETSNDWGNPNQMLQQAQFISVLNACMERVSAAMGRLFLMREWLER